MLLLCGLVVCTQIDAGLYKRTQNFFAQLRERFSHFFVTKETVPVSEPLPVVTAPIDTVNQTQEERDLAQAIAESKITAAQEEQKRAADAQKIQKDRAARERKVTQEKNDAALARALQEEENRGFVQKRTQENLRTQQMREDEQLARRMQQEEQAASARRELYQPIPLHRIASKPSIAGKPIYQIQALQQVGGTSCGYHTILNAKALEDIIFAKQQPSLDTITKARNELLKIEGLADIMKKESSLPMLQTTSEKRITNSQEKPSTKQLSVEKDQNIISFGELVRLLKNTYFITYSADSIIKPAGSSIHTPAGDIYTAIKNIWNSPEQPAVIHLPLLIGKETSGHWVYIGIVKNHGEKPYIVYLDSCNSPIVPNSPLAQVLDKIYELLGGDKKFK